MSNETPADLNTLTLIGMVEERGPAWHRRDDLQGAEDNHYQRFIPPEDVKRRLFGWEPNTVPVAYLVADPGFVQAPGHVNLNGKSFRVVQSQQGRIGVLRDDNDYDMGVFMSGAIHPPYQETLMRDVEMLVGEELGISSAGLLTKGSRAWVEFSLPETLHDDKSGLDYRPNLTKATSMDGSLAHNTFRSCNATVCDNTLTWNILEARAAGMLFRRKHTSGSLADLQSERDALGIINEVAAEFERELHALIEMEVSRSQVIEVLDIIVPLPENEGTQHTIKSNKRDEMLALYESNPMVAPWQGTAFGVVQLFNTWDHHFTEVRTDGGRSARNTWRDLTGKRASADREVVAALEMVLA